MRIETPNCGAASCSRPRELQSLVRPARFRRHAGHTRGGGSLPGSGRRRLCDADAASSSCRHCPCVWRCRPSARHQASCDPRDTPGHRTQAWQSVAASCSHHHDRSPQAGPAGRISLAPATRRCFCWASLSRRAPSHSDWDPYAGLLRILVSVPSQKSIRALMLLHAARKARWVPCGEFATKPLKRRVVSRCSRGLNNTSAARMRRIATRN
jgi:hypothetical protein